MRPLTLEIWYEALASEYGVVVAVSPNAELAKQQLYRIRAECKDPDLNQISICSSPTSPQNEIWLVRKTKDVNDVNSGKS